MNRSRSFYHDMRIHMKYSFKWFAGEKQNRLFFSILIRSSKIHECGLLRLNFNWMKTLEPFNTHIFKYFCMLSFNYISSLKNFFMYSIHARKYETGNKWMAIKIQLFRKQQIMQTVLLLVNLQFDKLVWTKSQNGHNKRLLCINRQQLLSLHFACIFITIGFFNQNKRNFYAKTWSARL